MMQLKAIFERNFNVRGRLSGRSNASNMAAKASIEHRALCIFRLTAYGAPVSIQIMRVVCRCNNYLTVQSVTNAPCIGPCHSRQSSTLVISAHFLRARYCQQQIVQAIRSLY